MTVFQHNLYEYRKGVRSLVLQTVSLSVIRNIEAKLRARHIDFVSYPLGKDKVNVFFGNTECIDVIRRIGKASLNCYTAEEDFILGIMLGYDRVAQCRRYLQKTTSAIDGNLSAFFAENTCETAFCGGFKMLQN
jgi:hypothetical protein